MNGCLVGRNITPIFTRQGLAGSNSRYGYGGGEKKNPSIGIEIPAIQPDASSPSSLSYPCFIQK
jgi:hypothetical protein